MDEDSSKKKRRVVSMGALRRQLKERGKLSEDEVAAQRPRTRGECVNGPRPCPWVSCRYHLLFDVTTAGSVRVNLEGWERLFEQDDANMWAEAILSMDETCALDVADRGATSMADVGKLVGGISKEMIRKICVGAGARFARMVYSE